MPIVEVLLVGVARYSLILSFSAPRSSLYIYRSICIIRFCPQFSFTRGETALPYSTKFGRQGRSRL